MSPTGKISSQQFRRLGAKAFALMPIWRHRKCCLCNADVFRFIPYKGGTPRLPPLMSALEIIGSDVDQFECPRCGCHDRERHLILYLEAVKLSNVIAGSRILHFAPELHVTNYLRRAGPLEYLGADLHPKGSQMQLDISNIAFGDDRFEIIIANHVLEHVQDDRAALREIFRVLVPGGYAILQTPFAWSLSKTFEDELITSEHARLQAFGQEDHVRLYGRDFIERVEACGLRAQVRMHSDLLPHINAQTYGVNAREPFFMFQKAS